MTTSGNPTSSSNQASPDTSIVFEVTSSSASSVDPQKLNEVLRQAILDHLSTQQGLAGAANKGADAFSLHGHIQTADAAIINTVPTDNPV